MSALRRAFAWASAGRYAVLAINLVATVATARLIGPAAHGISVLGASAFAVAEAIRERGGGGAYLIQQREWTLKKIRTSITISLLGSIALSIPITLLAGLLAHHFNAPGPVPVH